MEAKEAEAGELPSEMRRWLVMLAFSGGGVGLGSLAELQRTSWELVLRAHVKASPSMWADGYMERQRDKENTLCEMKAADFKP